MERTAPALININSKESKHIDIRGSVAEVGVELSFIISFLYSKLFLEGYSEDQIRNILDYTVEQGISGAKDIEEDLKKRRQQKNDVGKDGSESGFDGEVSEQDARAQ